MTGRRSQARGGDRGFRLDRFAPLLDAEPANRDDLVKAKIGRYQGAGGWDFAHLPAPMSAGNRANFAAAQRVWGSIPVRLRIGETQWDTSLFPARKTKTCLFAIKADLRKAEGIVDGSRFTASQSIR